jgi:hypothetical protein
MPFYTCTLPEGTLTVESRPALGKHIAPDSNRAEAGLIT